MYTIKSALSYFYPKPVNPPVQTPYPLNLSSTNGTSKSSIDDRKRIVLLSILDKILNPAIFPSPINKLKDKSFFFQILKDPDILKFLLSKASAHTLCPPSWLYRCLMNLNPKITNMLDLDLTGYEQFVEKRHLDNLVLTLIKTKNVQLNPLTVQDFTEFSQNTTMLEDYKSQLNNVQHLVVSIDKYTRNDAFDLMITLFPKLSKITIKVDSIYSEELLIENGTALGKFSDALKKLCAQPKIKQICLSGYDISKFEYSFDEAGEDIPPVLVSEDDESEHPELKLINQLFNTDKIQLVDCFKSTVDETLNPLLKSSKLNRATTINLSPYSNDSKIYKQILDFNPFVKVITANLMRLNASNLNAFYSTKKKIKESDIPLILGPKKISFEDNTLTTPQKTDFLIHLAKTAHNTLTNLELSDLDLIYHAQEIHTLFKSCRLNSLKIDASHFNVINASYYAAVKEDAHLPSNFFDPLYFLQKLKIRTHPILTNFLEALLSHLPPMIRNLDIEWSQNNSEKLTQLLNRCQNLEMLTLQLPSSKDTYSLDPDFLRALEKVKYIRVISDVLSEETIKYFATHLQKNIIALNVHLSFKYVVDKEIDYLKNLIRSFSNLKHLQINSKRPNSSDEAVLKKLRKFTKGNSHLKIIYKMPDSENPKTSSIGVDLVLT
jgi:hypothetical protein